MNNFTLLIDDFCPQITKNHIDFKVLMKLMDEYPIKVTLFIPADMRELLVDHPLRYNNFSFCHIDRLKSWSEWANSLASDRIELAMHGYYHWNYEQKNAKEFCDLGYTTTEERIDKMLKAFKAIPNATKGFRPPGHGISEDLLGILVERNFDYLAIHYEVKIPKKFKIKTIFTGIPGTVSAHFGCLAYNSLHKIEKDLRNKIEKGNHKYLRLIDL